MRNRRLGGNLGYLGLDRFVSQHGVLQKYKQGQRSDLQTAFLISHWKAALPECLEVIVSS